VKQNNVPIVLIADINMIIASTMGSLVTTTRVGNLVGIIILLGRAEAGILVGHTHLRVLAQQVQGFLGITLSHGIWGQQFLELIGLHLLGLASVIHILMMDFVLTVKGNYGIRNIGM
jgi:hypothetical protein